MDEILRDGPLDATKPGPATPGDLRGRAERSRGPEELMRFERAQFADVVVRPDELSDSRPALRGRDLGPAEDQPAEDQVASAAESTIEPTIAADLAAPGLPVPVAGEHADVPVTDPEQPAEAAAQPDDADAATEPAERSVAASEEPAPDRVEAEDAQREEVTLAADVAEAPVAEEPVTDAPVTEAPVDELSEIDATSAAAAVAAEADTAEIEEDLSDADDEGLPAVPELVNAEEVAKVVFVLMLTSREGLSVLRLAQACNTSQRLVEEALQLLPQRLQALGLPVELTRTGDAVKWMSSSASFPYLQRLRGVKKLEKLSPAALETLAVIAYRQPVMRSEIEAVRGVKAGPMLRSLLQHKLVRCTGRAEVPGRPLQYGTTQLFLERFGLASLQDLPSVKEWKNLG